MFSGSAHSQGCVYKEWNSMAVIERDKKTGTHFILLGAGFGDSDEIEVIRVDGNSLEELV